MVSSRTAPGLRRLCFRLWAAQTGPAGQPNLSMRTSGRESVRSHVRTALHSLQWGDGGHISHLTTAAVPGRVPASPQVIRAPHRHMTEMRHTWKSRFATSRAARVGRMLFTSHRAGTRPRHPNPRRSVPRLAGPLYTCRAASPPDTADPPQTGPPSRGTPSVCAPSTAV